MNVVLREARLISPFTKGLLIIGGVIMGLVVLVVLAGIDYGFALL